MTARLIESNQDMGVLDASLEEDIKGVAGTLYAAAEDTVSSVPPSANATPDTTLTDCVCS